MKEADYSGSNWTADSTAEANLVAAAKLTTNLSVSTGNTGAGADWMTGAWIKK